MYTDKYKAYDALICCSYRHISADRGKRFSNGKVYINGLEGFRSCAKECLMKQHRVSRKFFPANSSVSSCQILSNHQLKNPQGLKIKERKILDTTDKCAQLPR